MNDSLVPLRFLSRAMDKGLLAHAYLLAGPRAEAHGRTVSRLLLCHSPIQDGEVLVPCQQCDGCRKVDKAIHPDFHLVEPDGAMIKVDQVRSLHKDLSFPPLEWKRRVCLILEAHRMNQEAANALLKTLEEPPDHTYLILTTHSTKGLLPTVISRCQLVRCPPLSPERMRSMLPGEDGHKRLFFYVAAGDLDRARALEPEKVLELRHRVLELKTLEHPIPAVFRLADVISADRETTLLFVQIMKTIVRDLMVIIQAGVAGDSSIGYSGEPESEGKGKWTDTLVNSDMQDFLPGIAKKIVFEDLDRLSDRLYAAEILIERNINLTLLVLGLLLKWLMSQR